jgi:hypothetical protein
MKNLQRKMAELIGIEVGTKVRLVTIDIPILHLGWQGGWTTTMKTYIKSQGIVSAIEDIGVRVNFGEKGSDLIYPVQALEIVPEPPEIVKLNDQYNAEITKDGIFVGCQTIPLSVIPELVKATKKFIK